MNNYAKFYDFQKDAEILINLDQVSTIEFTDIAFDQKDGGRPYKVGLITFWFRGLFEEKEEVVLTFLHEDTDSINGETYEEAKGKLLRLLDWN